MIELQNISLEIQGKEILSDVNLKIKDGDVISVIGPSGMGKTILLRTILMLDRPTSGKILFNGKEILPNSADLIDFRKKLGMVFQNYNLFEDMTVIENVMLPQIDLLGKTKQEAYDYSMEWLRKVGLITKRFAYPNELGLGEKQRLAIARAVAMDPEIIFFDEPTASLEPAMRKEVHQVIRDIAKQGTTILLVTSEPRFAREISNRIVYFDEHTVYEEGKTSQMFTDPKRQKTRLYIKQLKLLNIQIDSLDFDFIGISTRIEKYIENQRIPQKPANAMHVIFEELCRGIILDELGKRKNFKLNLTYDYDEKYRVINVAIKYTGEAYNPETSTDELALVIIKHVVGEFKFTYLATEEYSNNIKALIQCDI